MGTGEKESSLERWRARAVLGGKDPTQLILARCVGQSFTVDMNGTTCEITICHIANNSVAVLIETPERNLVLRKELAGC